MFWTSCARKRRGSCLDQIEQTQAEVVISGDHWEGFLSSLERLISLHQKALERLKDTRTRQVAREMEPRRALTSPIVVMPRTDWGATETSLPVRRCRYCSNEIATSARFCDHCGRTNATLICRCGNEISGPEKTCARCGRLVVVS